MAGPPFADGEEKHGEAVRRPPPAHPVIPSPSYPEGRAPRRPENIAAPGVRTYFNEFEKQEIHSIVRWAVSSAVCISPFFVPFLRMKKLRPRELQ